MNVQLLEIPPFDLTERQQSARDLANSTAMFILLVGGSRSGKTFFLVRQVVLRALKAPGSRHLILRKAAVDTKAAIGLDTFPKVMELCFPDEAYDYNQVEGRITFKRNGAVIWLAGLDSHNLEKILGNEFVTIYLNEASQVPYSTFELLISRLAQKVIEADRTRYQRLKYYVDLNPTTTAHWTYRLWFDFVDPVENLPVNQALYAHLFMNPLDNQANLPPQTLDNLRAMSSRMRKRFYEGVYAGDAENALWRRGMIKRTARDVRDLKKILVAIDPAMSNDPGSNETGIVCGGIDAQGQGYLLADESGHFPPEKWARIALALNRDFGGDGIVAEVNQGGDLVASMIQAMWTEGNREEKGSLGLRPRVQKVHATRGKWIRAEPIAGLYERGKIYHVGTFPELEDQMCAFTTDFDRKEQGYSPDRLDAMVWLYSALFGELTKKKPDDKPRAPPRPAGDSSWMGN